MLSVPPGPNSKGFPVEAASERCHGFFGNILKADKRESGDFLNSGNTEDTHQFIHHRARQTAAFGHINIYSVPAAFYDNILVKPGQNSTDVLAQLTHLATTNRLALDSNLRGRTNKQFHKWAFCRMVYDQESA